jgi:murein DD-endopeptidase MepM/ murein hydrolase activator NlpD
MAKHKYKFNPESLSYIRVTRSTKQKFTRFITYFSASIILALLYVLIYSSFFDSPVEKGLKRQIGELKINYDLVNDQLGSIDAHLTELQKRDDNIYRTIFEAKPVNPSVREAGFGGSNKYRDLGKIENSEIIIGVKSHLDKIMKKIYVQSVSYDKIWDLAKNKEKMLASIPAIMPISNKDLTLTASGWGFRVHPIYHVLKFHFGMDFTSPPGTDVYVTGDGIVEETDCSKTGYGNKIVINHGYGYKTIYGHLRGFNVKPGQKVHRGDIIGFVGSSGLSTGPHLHYEVELNNTKVNPVNYYFNDLTNSEYEKMIDISYSSSKSFD